MTQDKLNQLIIYLQEIIKNEPRSSLEIREAINTLFKRITKI